MLLSLLIAVMAGVISHFICKQLDSDKQSLTSLWFKPPCQKRNRKPRSGHSGFFPLFIHEITLSVVCIFLKCRNLKIPQIHTKGLFFIENFQLSSLFYYFQMRSIRFRFGLYGGMYLSTMPNFSASSCTTAHFWYLALSSTRCTGSPLYSEAIWCSMVYTFRGGYSASRYLLLRNVRHHNEIPLFQKRLTLSAAYAASKGSSRITRTVQRRFRIKVKP